MEKGLFDSICKVNLTGRLVIGSHDRPDYPVWREQQKQRDGTCFEQHGCFEVCVGISGKFGLHFETGTFLIGPGEGAVIFPGVLHKESHYRDTNHAALWFAAAPDWVYTHLVTFRGKSERTDRPCCRIQPEYDFLTILEKVHREAVQTLPFYKERAVCLVQEIIIHLKRHVTMFENDASSFRGFSDQFDYIKKKKTEEVKRYLKDHIAETVRLADIADKLCLSESYLSAVFKSQTGLTIMQYLEQLRIERAALLLKTTGNAVKSIAYELGYYDPYHFSRKFKMKTGYSPMGFRNRQTVCAADEGTG